MIATGTRSHRLVLALVLLGSTAACGDSTPTGPTQSSLVFHDTMNPAASRNATRVWMSSWWLVQGRQTPGSVIADDFVPNQSGQIRTVHWQGGYCDGRFNVPHVAPEPSALQFYVSFVSDLVWGPENFDLPPSYAPDRYFTIPSAQVQHARLFDLVPNENDPCVSKGAAAISYYEHAATLPNPVSVVAGRRYWLEISADIGTSRTVWGWRVGVADNGRAITNLRSIASADMAFKLTN